MVALRTVGDRDARRCHYGPQCDWRRCPDQAVQSGMAAGQRRTRPRKSGSRERSRTRRRADAAAGSHNRRVPDRSVVSSFIPGRGLSPRPERHHSFMPLARTTLLQRSYSFLKNLPNSAGVSATGMAPESISFFFTTGSLIAFTNASLILAMIEGG